MLRIHFSAQDLVRTRLVAAADPLWELLLSHFLLHERRRPAFLSPWVRAFRADPRVVDRARPALSLLAGLAPQGPYFPDLLTPVEAGGGLDAGLAAVADTSRARFAKEVGLLVESRRRGRRPVAPWLRRFAEADRTAVRHLVGSLRIYHEAAIAPHDDIIAAAVAADVAHRTRVLRDDGVEGFFLGFAPLMTWRPPVLEVQYDVDQELHLNGRGLRFIPSFFCHGSAVSIADPELTPTVIYPLPARQRWTTLSTNGSLAALVGATRAAMLTHLGANASSTTELARAVSISPASVSRHAATLREAGLLVTHRDHNTALHTLTELGRQLLGRTG